MDWLRSIVNRLTDEEAPTGDPWSGGTQQGARLKGVAEYCIANFPGDLIEIGCYSGVTTLALATIAQSAGRRVIALDPWAEDSHIYDVFLQYIQEYRDIIDVIRLSSQDHKAIARIRKRGLTFAFIDGLHTYNAALTDIVTVGHCAGVIAVDDVSYKCEPEDLRPAFLDGARAIGRAVYWHPKCREGYLLPC